MTSQGSDSLSPESLLASLRHVECAFDLKSTGLNADREARQILPVKSTLMNSSTSHRTAADSRMPPLIPKDGSKTRFESAHTSRSPSTRDTHEATISPSVLSVVAGHDPKHVDRQLNRHGQELGEELRREQRELDQRQANFNARLAATENEMRTARLLLHERELELRERTTEFERRWKELKVRTTDVSVAQLALEAGSQLPSAQDDQKNQNALLKETLEQWQSRVSELEDSERILQAQMADIADQRQQLQSKQELFIQQRSSDREQFEKEIDQIQTGLKRRWRQLQQRSKTLTGRRQALERLHTDVMRMYREMTEMRLITEELWGQLNKQVSPAKLTKSMATLRRKLADQFQMASESLTVKRQELSEMVTRLRENHAKLREQRDQMQGWLTRQHDEFEQQAARLIAREHKLDQREQQLQAQEASWKDKQNQYEQELRRLRRFDSDG